MKPYLDKPFLIERTPANIAGQPVDRVMAVYWLRPCTYNKCAGCSLSDHSDSHVSDANILNQHKVVIDSLNEQRPARFDLFGPGNFFNDDELSPNLRTKLMAQLSSLDYLKLVVVESRPEDITSDKLREYNNSLGPKIQGVYCMGWESSNDVTRNNHLNKNVPRVALEDCIRTCKDAGVDFMANVRIKPYPLSEKEGIEQAVATALDVLKKGEDEDVTTYVAFQPEYLPDNSPANSAFNIGEYRPPSLWSIVEVIVRTADELGVSNTNGKLFVGMSAEELADDGRISSIPSSCNFRDCDEKVRAAIYEFNKTQDVLKLKQLCDKFIKHSCLSEWRDEIK
ncbi:hypothetical protein JXA85_02210 [Candidatus Woesearchaeota archaeon]|nr:hypothetical protein [Candidatus Woesearchaeota archaeon]